MTNLQTVQFNNRNLFIIEHQGEPFAPMRPIVEGMGMSWTRQYRKIQNNSKRWQGVALKATTEKDGKTYEMLSMPVRKLPAFMASIHPSRVKPELRETIELYQDECDNALWAYWSEGQATNPRATITPDQQRTIQETVAELAHDNKAYSKYYGALKTQLRVGTYKDIPASQFEEALEVLHGVVIESKQVKEEKPSLAHRRFLLSYDHEGKEHILPIPHDAYVMSVPQLLKAINEPNGAYISTKDLTEFTVAATQRLQQRCEYYQKKSERIM